MADTFRRFVPDDALIAGWDFSTSAVKCRVFDLSGNVVAWFNLPTDLWTGGPKKNDVSELNVAQLEGQARASVRAIAAELREAGRLSNWLAGGISATHHTAARIDRCNNQVRRAICWNDPSLATFHAQGLARLGGQERVAELIGGPWAIRYSLSHLMKDATQLSPDDWQRTQRMLLHGPLAAGYLTGNFDVTSVSSAASTGIMDFRTCQWRREMLDAIETPAKVAKRGIDYRELAWQQLPRIVDQFEPIGPLAPHVALEAGIADDQRPLVFPTSDDQQAGLIGGGAVDPGQLAIILGTSVVVNSSSDRTPSGGSLDVMRLNWGPYLWMRCYSNGAELIHHFFGAKPNYAKLEAEAAACPPGLSSREIGGRQMLPFLRDEPSLGAKKMNVKKTWNEAGESKPTRGETYRAILESLAYMIALGVRAHEQAGQSVRRITVSGGIARSNLMCQILATTLGREIVPLVSDEGPALGAAVTALAALEVTRRRQHGDATPVQIADAVTEMVRYREAIQPVDEWRQAYAEGLATFKEHF